MKHRRVIRIFVFVAFFYLLFYPTRFSSSDGQAMYETGRALALRQTFRLESDFGLPQIRRYATGGYYSHYDPFLPVLSAPLIYVTDKWAAVNRVNRYAFSAYSLHLVPTLGVLLSLGALYGLAHPLYGRRVSVWLVLGAGLCTPLGVYASQFFAEGLLAGLLTLAVWGAAQGKMGIAGLALGLALATRAGMAIYTPALAWLCLGRQPTWAGGVRFGLGLSLGVGLLMWQNSVRSGNPLTFGYGGQGFSTPFWEGAAGFLLSPDKSVFVYAPLLLAAVMSGRRFYARDPRLAQTLALMSLSALLFYGAWWAWEGGWSWGPRFLVPLLPLCLLPLGEWLAHPLPRWGQALLITAAFWGGLLMLAGSLTDVNRHYARHGMVHYALTRTAWLSALESLWRGETLALGLFDWRRMGWVPLTADLIPLGVVLGAMWGAWGLRHELRGDSNMKDERG